MSRPKDSRFPYMPGIDAMRALAVLAVFGYHAGLDWVPGGFLGVDVFFVISGYLITSLLLREFRSTDHIELGRFWLRPPPLLAGRVERSDRRSRGGLAPHHRNPLGGSGRRRRRKPLLGRHPPDPEGRRPLRRLVSQVVHKKVAFPRG